MRSHEEWFEAERTRAKKFRIARNAIGAGFAGFYGLQLGAEVIAHTDLTPNDTPISYAFSAITGIAAIAALRLHGNNLRSESAAFRAAAYEINDVTDTSNEPGEWAVSALAEANLAVDDVIESKDGSVIRPKTSR